MLILSHDELIGLLPPLRILEAVELALHADAAGRVLMPERQHVDWDGNTLLVMPAVAERCCGVKLVSVVPGNATRGQPVTNGIMILNDSTTGLPLALMDAAAITAQRTGAVGALGVKYFTPDDIGSVGIVGCGVQGAWQAIAACAVRPISEIFCVARSAASLHKFTEVVRRQVPGVRISPCRDAAELLQRTALVIAATTSPVPVLPDDPQQLQGKHFISVGSYRPSMQELPDAVYRVTGMLAVDSPHARHEAGDVINPVRRGILEESDIVAIRDFVIGARVADRSRGSAYKSVGAAHFDLYAAQALYRHARSRRLGREVSL